MTIPELFASALSLHQSGKLQSAEELYRQILRVEEHHADIWHLLGVIDYQRGRHAQAIELIGRAIGLKDNEAAYYCNRGVAFKESGKLDEAITSYRRALELNPGYAEAYNNLGNALRDQGNADEAVTCFRRALEIKPTYPEAYNNLGLALQDQGKLDETIHSYSKALELKPEYAEARNNLGNVLKEQGKAEESIACYQRAIELKPRYVEAHNNMGNLFSIQGKLDESLQCYRRALELKPDYADAHNNIGYILTTQGKLDEAITCYQRAIELRPEYAEALNNLGITLQSQGNLSEAIGYYPKAIKLKPEYAQAHLNQGLAFLVLGDWERGWPEYEWRWKTKDLTPRGFSQPMWNGEPLAWRTILIHAEQGIGDTLQFIRYAPLIKQQGTKVIFECQKALIGLLEGIPGVDQIVPQNSKLPPFDLHVPMMSLPRTLKTKVETIPANVPYLFPKPGLVESWKEKLSSLEGFKIGINWQGSKSYRYDHFRSIPLRVFEPLARIPGVRLISLQKGYGIEQLHEIKDLFPVIDLGTELDQQVPFLDTAAVMKNLDLVISPDTATAHLAGALGVPVWLALSFSPHWVWLLNRSDSPWYPTMRLFRQRELGKWEHVFEEMRTALSEKVQS